MKKKIFAFGTLFIIIITTLIPIFSTGLTINKNKNLNKSDFCIKPAEFPNLPGYLVPGDIVIFFYQNADLDEHSVMYIGGENGEEWFIESSLTGKYSDIDSVKKTNLSTMWKKHNDHIWVYATVKTGIDDQKRQAINWSLTKLELGDKFQKIPVPGYNGSYDNWAKTAERNDSHYAPDYKLIKNNYNEWYYSELIWAAYYNISDGEIDIDWDGWSCKKFSMPTVSGKEILKDNDVKQVVVNLRV